MELINEILKNNINWFNSVNSENRVIGWISGGVASAVACSIALEKYDNVFLAFCDTNAEHPDTYRFINDFENKFNVKVNFFKSEKFNNPEEVWRKFKGLNFAYGAPCSTILKREVRVKQVQKLESDYAQIFGFDFCKKEVRRANQMIKNYAEINPKFPLIENEITRQDLFRIIKEWGIKRPTVYDHFDNNNCIGPDDSKQGGCVQGGIGYWQKMREVYPLKYENMAKIEHELSEINGKPTTICKDQRKENDRKLLFLTKNKNFPEIETIDVIKGKQPIGCVECTGFCGTEDQMALKFN